VTVCCKLQKTMICTIGPRHYAQLAAVPKVVSEIIRLFVQITLLRRGPQDLPASPLLLALTVGGFVAVCAAISSLLPPNAGWAPQLLVETLFTLAWYAALLQLVGRSERFLQAATAVFGLRLVLAPLIISSQWLMRRFMQDTTWQLPVAVGGLALVIWLIAANSHVVKAALDWSSAASVALVILQIVAGELLLLALFAPGG
jgi:hypothetical protein